MHWRLPMLIFCTGSYLMWLPLQAALPDTSCQAAHTTIECKTPALASLEAIATAITVKVLSGNSWGSGVLLKKQGQVYTVVTNDHVLTPGYGQQYRIQTPDKKIYPATVSAARLNGNDLALLQFTSPATYKIATSGINSKLAVGERVFAAGFPFEAKGFVFTTGEVELILDRALDGGYQLGYTNDIQKGMSGGPVLNSRGEVVAINAMHSYPIWGNPYVYKDGSLPSVAMLKQMRLLSWAVPVQNFGQLSVGWAKPTNNSHILRR